MKVLAPIFRQVWHGLSILVVIPLMGLGLAPAETLRVGEDERFSTPCEAILAARSGDIVEITTAVYTGDVCSWNTSGLTIRGVGGKPRMNADGKSAADQGLWVIDGDNTVIENVDLSGAFANDGQGAGIRLNGRNLTIRNSTFHHNQSGVTVSDSEGDNVVLIEYAEFGHNEVSNLVVGHVSKLMVHFSYSHHLKRGNLINSKAMETYVEYSRFMGGEGKTAEEVAFPMGGRVSLVGNVIQKGAGSLSGSVVGFLTEGLDQHNVNDLQVINNTFVSDFNENVVFIDVPSNLQSRVILRNNVFSGQGAVSNFKGAVLTSNLAGVDPGFLNVAEHDYRLHTLSGAIDMGSVSQNSAENDIVPAYSPVCDGCFVARDIEGPIDIGAFELGAVNCVQPVVEGSRATEKMAGKRTISAVLSLITVNPSSAAGGAWTTANYVYLSAPAPIGGAVVAMLSSHPSVVTLPLTVAVPAGAMSQRFNIKTTFVTTATPVSIVASYAGATTTKTLMVDTVRISSLVLSPNSFGGGLTTVGNKLILNGPAPSGGVTVSLSSSDPSVLLPPSTVTVSGGVNTAVFAMASSTQTTTKNAVITATFAGEARIATATVGPVSLETVWTTPTSIVSGSTSCILRVKLNGPAPASGAPVSIWSANPLVATAPTTITVAPGAVEAFAFLDIKWVNVKSSASFTASYVGFSTTTALAVTPTSLYVVLLSPKSIKGGTTTTGNYVKLNGKAPTGGQYVTLISSNPGTAAVPPSVLVPAGNTTAYFSITTRAVASSTPVQISGSLHSSKSATLSLLP